MRPTHQPPFDAGAPMRIGVVGAGYVGLVTAALFCELGHHVTLLDADPERVEALRRGVCPIHEPGLPEALDRARLVGRLHVTAAVSLAARDKDLIFLAVGTPPLPDGEADLRQLREAVRQLAPALTGHTIVVTKSTVPVGTGDRVARWLNDGLSPGATVGVVSNPEFLREGEAMHDALHPDRVVIGADTDEDALPLFELYAPLQRPIVVTSLRSAELIKHSANAFLAMKISFANDVAALCERVGADVHEVMDGIGRDDRIGPAFLRAGLGYGGSCFPKDTLALLSTARATGLDFGLVRETVAINEQALQRFIERLRRRFGSLDGLRVAALGLAFKPFTDDVRESRAMAVIHRLLAEGAEVRAFDPVAMPAARRALPGVRTCQDAYEAAEGADALLVLTEWPEFARLDWTRVSSLMARPVAFDGRNVLPAERLRAAGFEVHGIGRGGHPLAEAPARRAARARAFMPASER